MKSVRIDFCDFWPGFRKDDNRLYNLLKTRYAVDFFGLDRVLDHFEEIFSASTRPVAQRPHLFGRWTLARRDPT